MSSFYGVPRDQEFQESLVSKTSIIFVTNKIILPRSRAELSNLVMLMFKRRLFTTLLLTSLPQKKLLLKVSSLLFLRNSKSVHFVDYFVFIFIF